MSSADKLDGTEQAAHTQSLFVMRHGERIDHIDPTWVNIAARPWDPPLTEEGKLDAFAVGQRFRRGGTCITRVFVSPFLRCVQTASEVIKGMCSIDTGGGDLRVVTSNVKVSIEYGLSARMNSKYIGHPPGGVMGLPNLSWMSPLEELHGILPCGVLDTFVQPIVPTIPVWGESKTASKIRLSNTFTAITDQFPRENVLCISHGGAVEVLQGHYTPDLVLKKIPCCGFTRARREVLGYLPLIVGPWKLLNKPSRASGFLLYK